MTTLRLIFTAATSGGIVIATALVALPAFSPSLVSPVNVTSRAAAVQSLTNSQKLSLAADTPIGTRVSVTDGFAVTGASISLANGLYTQTTSLNGKGVWKHVGAFENPDDQAEWDWADVSGEGDFAWQCFVISVDVVATSFNNVGSPWEITTWDYKGFSTLTHPAIQTLVAQPPSSEANWEVVP